MTGCGQAGLPPLRPTTPADPTLTSQPVPRKRSFPIRSFGPGAAIDTGTTEYSDWKAMVAFWEELDRAADAESENSSSSWSDARHLLDAIKRTETTVYREDGAFTPEPTLSS